MRAPLSLVPLLPGALAFAGGILISYFGVPLWYAGIWIVAGIILAIRKLRYFAALAAAVALGQSDMWMQTPAQHIIHGIIGEKYLTADVYSVKETETSQILGVKILEAGSDSTNMLKIEEIRSQIVIPAFTPAISAGDRVMIKAKMSYPDSIEYFPGQLTYRKILSRQGIIVSGIAAPDNIYRIEKSSALLLSFTRLKSKIQYQLLSSSLKAETKEFLVTAITGDSSILDSDIRQTFAKAGIAHILALSGLHVGIIMAICSLLLFPLILFPLLRNSRPILIISALWLFAFITGLSPSVVRAVIMASCFLLAILLQKRHSSFNTLCLAALIILLFDPNAILSISFQLSFAAVTGILLFGKILNPIPERNRQAYNTMGFITMSAGAMIATGMISCFYFHTFPIYFLVANVLISPILAPLIGGGIIVIILTATGHSSSTLCRIVDALYEWVEGVGNTVANIPGSTINHLSISTLSLVIWLAAIIFLSFFLYKRRRVFGYTTVLTTVTFFSLLLLDQNPESRGVYIVPGTYRTDIAVCSPTRIDIISTAPHREKEKIRDNSLKSFSEYMLKHNIDTLEISGKKFSNEFVLYDYPLLTIGTKRIIVADSEPSIHAGVSVDYILVCRGYRGTIENLSSKYNCKNIILSGDLHPKRLANYIKECGSMAIPYTSLRNQAFSNLLTEP
ncbi:MAG: competence protein ComEC family protein [Paramuribaculum sp.]|nr:competence protein ComEC family protein [Paramuribaculum sp.]